MCCAVLCRASESPVPKGMFAWIAGFSGWHVRSVVRILVWIEYFTGGIEVEARSTGHLCEAKGKDDRREKMCIPRRFLTPRAQPSPLGIFAEFFSYVIQLHLFYFYFTLRFHAIALLLFPLFVCSLDWMGVEVKISD